MRRVTTFAPATRRDSRAPPPRPPAPAGAGFALLVTHARLRSPSPQFGRACASARGKRTRVFVG
jgi:hypothetical protein